MSVRLSYEPSVQALVEHLLHGAAVLGEPEGMRNRISWPVAVRATGLGRLEGGEVVVVPPGREDGVLGQLHELQAAGVAGIIVHPSAPLNTGQLSDSDVPVVLSAEVAESRRLREDIERYIMRRRRDLFALDQRLHRLLVDTALGGASLQRLLDITHAETAEPAMLEVGTEVLSSGIEADAAPGHLARRSGLAVRGDVAAAIPQGDGLTTLATPVLVASRRRGTALVLDVRAADVDDREVVVTSLASAAAIALAQLPESPIPSLEEALAGPERKRFSGGGWTAIALAGDDVQRLARAVRAEAGSRGFDPLLAARGDVLFGFLPGSSIPGSSWLRDVSRRAGADSLRAGVSRPHSGFDDAELAAGEAADALRLGESGITRFEDVELHSLLGKIPGSESFVRRTLGPILSRPDLVVTLDSYLRSGRNVTQAATSLGIHRNTLMYRLKRCRALLEADIDDAETAFALQLALWLRSVHEGAISEGASSG